MHLIFNTKLTKLDEADISKIKPFHWGEEYHNTKTNAIVAGLAAMTKKHDKTKNLA